MRIPLAARTSKGDHSALSSTRLLNWYPEVIGQDSTAPYALIPTPGFKLFSATSGDRIAGMLAEGNFLYCVTQNRLKLVDSNGTVVDKTSTRNFAARVSMASNGTQIMIVGDEDGDGRGWIYSTLTTSMVEISDVDFPSASHVTFLDGYFVVCEKNTGKIWISGLYDGTTWDALDFATAESDPDNLVTLITSNRELWLFGEDTTEVWVNTGGTFPFERSAVIQRGCSAEWSVARLDDAVYWLGDDRSVYVNNGYIPTRISSVALETAIDNMTTYDDAFAFAYHDKGHHFYVLNFPTENQCWVFDTTTREWHERDSFGKDQYSPNCHAYIFGKNLVGAHDSGRVLEMDHDTYTDNTGTTIQRIAQFPEVRNELENIQFRKLQIEFEQGVGNATEDDPQAMLQWSDDGGKTWSNEHWRDIGQVGEYGYRSIWRRLGRFKKRVFRLKITDPVKAVVLNAFGE